MGITPPGIPNIIETPNSNSAEERLRDIDRIREEAIASHKISAEKMAKKITSKFKPFALGQQVWLEAKNLKLPLPSKIRPKRFGPYPIIEVLSPWNYKLKLP